MKPVFIDTAAQRRWDAYFTDVDRLLARAGSEVSDLREDLELHVVDSMAASPEGGSELDRLETALGRLGRPIDFLRPLLADELIERGTRTYRPTVIARGLFHAALAGSARAVVALGFGLGYLSLAIFTAMAVLKPLWGEHVGLFRYPDGSISAGIVHHVDGSREMLGWWSIPLALALAGGIYVVLTKMLGTIRKRR